MADDEATQGRIAQMPAEMAQMYYTLQAMHDAWVAGLVGTSVDAQQAMACLAYDIGVRMATLLQKAGPEYRELLERIVQRNIECGMQQGFDAAAAETGHDGTQTRQ